MARRRGFTQQKPKDASEAAALVRKCAIDLFDREDGKAADWPLIADTLLRAAFSALDEAPDDPRTESLLRRVHAGSYNRLVNNDDDAARGLAGASTSPESPFDPQPAASPDLPRL